MREDIVDVACEIVAEDAHDDEMRAETIAVLDERVVILLGRITEMSRVEDRHLGLQVAFKVMAQAFGGRFIVAYEHSLHERVTENDAAQRRVELGLGTAQAPRIC